METLGSRKARILLSIVITGTGIFGLNRWATGETPGGVQLPRVKTTLVKLSDLMAKIEIPGTVRGIETAMIYSKVGGYLEKLSVEIGDRVTKGQVMAWISVPEMETKLTEHELRVAHAEAMVRQATAAVNQARAKHGTAQSERSQIEAHGKEREAAVSLRRKELELIEELLATSPSVEKRKLDEAKYRLELAEAAMASLATDIEVATARIADAQAGLDKAKADENVAQAGVALQEGSLEHVRSLLAYAEIKAPFDGYVTERQVDPGAFIQPASSNSAAMPLLTVQRMDKVRIIVHIPMDSVDKLDPGDSVVFDRITALPNRQFIGKVTRVARALHARTRMMRAEIELDNPDDKAGFPTLRPGYYGYITLLLESHRAKPSVPASAIGSDESGKYVYVVDGGRCRRRMVESFFNDGIVVGISSGLREGDEVVSTGIDQRRDGEEIRAVQVSDK